MIDKPYKPIDDIYNYALKKGVIILFDVEGITPIGQMGSKFSYDRHNRELLIVIDNLDAQEKVVVQGIIRKLYESGETLFKQSKENTLSKYVEYKDNNTDKEILDFFQKILPPDDYSALKMGLFIRDLMNDGKPIYTYKQDIRDRFGERGANIANLCTAGYFEEEFIPFYQQYSSQEFEEYYELAVGKKARALFIHSMMTPEHINDEFENILTRALRFHMTDFRIHALGRSNVNAIKDFFSSKSENEKEYTWSIKYERSHPQSVIEYVVTVKYND